MISAPQEVSDSFLKAVIKVQSYIRKMLTQKKVRVSSIGPGIVNIHLNTSSLSEILGSAYAWLDRDKPHEIMITTINTDKTCLELVTNQGNPDHFLKYLSTQKASYGAVINGGYYDFGSFYKLPFNMPIGLHKFNLNYKPNVKKGCLRKSVNNLDCLVEFDETSVTDGKESYGSSVETKLNKKMRVPHSYKSDYATVSISDDNLVEITPYNELSKSNEAFGEKLSKSKNVLSSGPILILESEIVFTEDRLKLPEYQFQALKKLGKTHPGELPPGTFYHADQPNPRAALAKTSASKLMMISVKGEEDPHKRDGLTLSDFAKLISYFKPTAAVNLDGGFSAFQGVFDSQTMYTPDFIKQCGNGRLVPCSLVATGLPKIRQETSKENAKPKQTVEPKQLRDNNEKNFFPATFNPNHL